MAEVDLGLVKGVKGDKGEPGREGPPGPKGTGIDISKLQGHADMFKSIGYRYTDITSEGLPGELEHKEGVISYFSDIPHDTVPEDRGIQTFYSTRGTQNGRIYTREFNGVSWGKWEEVLTTRNSFKQTDWGGTETIPQEDPEHIKERGFIKFPFGLNSHKISIHWFKIDTATYDKAEIIIPGVAKVLNVQITQNDQSLSHEDDVFTHNNKYYRKKKGSRFRISNSTNEIKYGWW